MLTRKTAHLVQALTVVALLLASLSAMAVDVWLSGPSTFWANGGSALTLVVTQDFEAVLGSGVSVSTIVPQVSPLSPAIGAVVSFTPPSPMTDAEALDKLYVANFPNMNAAAQGFSVTVHALRVMPTAAVLVDSGMTALSGPSFFWGVAVNQPSIDNAVLVAPLQVDVQKAVDADEQTYLVHIVTPTVADVNASAMFVNYEWYSIGSGSLSAAELTDKLNAAPLTSFNTYLRTLVASGSPLYDYRDLMPSNVGFTRALYENPTAPEDVVVPVLFENETRVLMYFSGTSSGWDRTSEVLSTTLATEATAVMQRGGFTNAVIVDALSYVTADKNTAGGLVVEATVTQGAQSLELESWDGDEVASVLLLGTYSGTIALYTGEGTAELTAVRLDKKYGFKCTAGCVGMIVMAAIIVFIMILVIVLTCVCLCCCAHYSVLESRATSTELAEDHEPLTASTYDGSRKSPTFPDEEL